MIKIESTIQHCLGQELAVQRMHQLEASLTQRFPQQVHQVQLHFKDHWIDVRFVAYGYPVQWRAEIYDDQVTLIGDIPDSARRFQRKIEQAILQRVEAVLVMGYRRRAA